MEMKEIPKPTKGNVLLFFYYSRTAAAFSLVCLSPLTIMYCSSPVHPIKDELTHYAFSSSLLDLWLLCSFFAVLSSTHAFLNMGAITQLLLQVLSTTGAVICSTLKGLYSNRLHERGVVFAYTWIACLTTLIIAVNIAESALYHMLSSSSKDEIEVSTDLEAPLLHGNEESSSFQVPEKYPTTRETSETKSKGASVMRLLSIARSELCLTIYAVMALAISSTCSLAQPYFFGLMINSSTLTNKEAHTQHRLDTYAIVLVVIFFIGGVTSAIRGYLFNLIGERLVRNLRSQLFTAIIRQDIAFFDQNKTGELVSRLSTDTVAIQSCLSVNVSMGLRSVAQVVVSIVLLFLTSWSLTLVMLAVVPLLVVVAVVWGRYTKGLSKDYQDSLAKAADIGSETIGNMRIVKAFASEELEAGAYIGAVEGAYRKGAKKAIFYGLFVGALMFLSNAAILLVIYYGASLVIRGHMTVGDLTAFVLYSIYITVGLASCTDLYSELMSALGASERIFRILDTEPSIPSRGGVWPDYGAPGAQHLPAVSSTSAVGLVGKKGSVKRVNDTDDYDAEEEEEEVKEGKEEDQLRNREAAFSLSQPSTAGSVSLAVCDETEALLAFRGQSDTTSPPVAPGEFNKKGGTCSHETGTKLRESGILSPIPHFTLLARPRNRGAVTFKDVGFRYPARPDVEVLKEFNLHIAARQTVALVGASGSGKSTALSLLERFYDATSGSILIDGVDIRLLDSRWLHRSIAIVPQEPVLFSGTIRDNISYARRAAWAGSSVGDDKTHRQQAQEAHQRGDEKSQQAGSSSTDEDIIEAAKKAFAHDFIMALPEGYDTIVGERGVRLSGGQKQRVAIARALLADPMILLLDEATSALDSESEQLVQRAIDTLMRDRTVIVIAHRLSTVRDADVIAVCQNGRVVDADTHEALLQRCEVYQNLVSRQLQWTTSTEKLEDLVAAVSSFPVAKSSPPSDEGKEVPEGSGPENHEINHARTYRGDSEDLSDSEANQSYSSMPDKPNSKGNPVGDNWLPIPTEEFPDPKNITMGFDKEA